MPSPNPTLRTERRDEGARLQDLDGARRLGREVIRRSTANPATGRYLFSCDQGRLKLREFAGVKNELIAYARPDEAAPRASQYRIVPVADVAALREASRRLSAFWWLSKKLREFSLYNNVRIHLDQVRGTRDVPGIRGRAGCPPNRSILGDRSGARTLGPLWAACPTILFRRSYSDLLLAAQKALSDVGCLSD